MCVRFIATRPRGLNTAVKTMGSIRIPPAIVVLVLDAPGPNVTAVVYLNVVLLSATLWSLVSVINLPQ